jgi:hypothetical protein
MFSFFSKIRTEVSSSISALHERLVNLETRVDALFHHVTTTTVTAVEAPAAIEAEVKNAVTEVTTEVNKVV